MKKVFAEFLGTAVLLTAIVGSGIMATDLTNDVGLQLLINCVAVVAALFVLISIFGSVSGAQFNPIVSVFLHFRKLQNLTVTCQLIAAQLTGAIVGAKFAEVIFNESLGQIATRERNSIGLLISEVFASAGLILIIGFVVNGKARPETLVPAWVGGAYFFTSSTIFANPAVTVGRTFSDSFTGIHPNSIFGFIVAQFIGLFLALPILKALSEEK